MENRNHKDSLFIDLFCKDQKSGKENFISLYNALHQTNLDLKTTTLQEVNIENILYMALSNDIAMLVDGRLVVLVEHQSTINENMPLRLLEYDILVLPHPPFVYTFASLPSLLVYIHSIGDLRAFPPISALQTPEILAYLQGVSCSTKLHIAFENPPQTYCLLMVATHFGDTSEFAHSLFVSI